MEMEVKKMEKVKRKVKNEVCKNERCACLFVHVVSCQMTIMPFSIFLTFKPYLNTFSKMRKDVH